MNAQVHVKDRIYTPATIFCVHCIMVQLHPSIAYSTINRMHYACMHNFYCTNNVGSPVQTHYLHRTRLQPVVCIWDTALVFVFSSFQVQTQSVITSHPTEPSIEIFLSVFLVDKSGANLPNNTLVCLQLENWHLKV